MDTAKVTRPDNLTKEENEIFDRIVGRDKNHLRSSKPKLKDAKTDVIGGKAAYVWRMLCFYLGTRGVDQCMPVCADMDIIAPSLVNEYTCYQCTKANPGGEQSHTFEVPANIRVIKAKHISHDPKFDYVYDKTLITCPEHGEETQPDVLGNKALPSVNIYQTAKVGQTSSKLRREVTQQLEDGIINKIIKASPVRYNSGMLRWGRALGTVDPSVGSSGNNLVDLLS